MRYNQFTLFSQWASVPDDIKLKLLDALAAKFPADVVEIANELGTQWHPAQPLDRRYTEGEFIQELNICIRGKNRAVAVKMVRDRYKLGQKEAKWALDYASSYPCHEPWDNLSMQEKGVANALVGLGIARHPQ